MKKNILIILLVACAFIGNAQNNHAVSGAEYFKYHDYSKAFEEFSKGAQQNDTYSQFFVVFLTYAGVGTPQNVDKAFSLIGKYAQKNDEMCEFAASFYSGEKWSFTYLGEVLSTDALDVESMGEKSFSKALRFVDLYEKKHKGNLTKVLSSIKGYCYFRGEGGLPQDYDKAFEYLSNGLEYSNLISYNDAVDEYLGECSTIESLNERGDKLKSMMQNSSTEQLKDIDRKIDQGINKLIDNWMIVNKSNLDNAYVNCTPGMKSIIDQRFDGSVREALNGINANNLGMVSPSSLEQAASRIKGLYDRSDLSLQKQTAKEIWTVLSLWAAYNKTDMKWQNYENVFSSEMFCPDIFTGISTCELLPEVPNVVDVNLRQIKHAINESGLNQYCSRNIGLLSCLADNKTANDNPSSILNSLQAKCDVLKNTYPTNGHYQLKDLDKPSKFHLGRELSNRYQDQSLSSGNVVEYETLLEAYNDCLRTIDGNELKGDIELLKMLTDSGTPQTDKIQEYLQKYPDSPYADYLNDQYAIDRINKLDKNSSKSDIKSVRNLPMSKEVSELAKKKAKSVALEKRNGYHIVTIGLQGSVQPGILLFDNYGDFENIVAGFGWGGGLALDFRFTNIIGIRAEGEYAHQSFKETQNLLDFSIWYEGVRRVSLNYINIPVMLTINPNATSVWELGVQYGLCQGGTRYDEIGNAFNGEEDMSSDEYNNRVLSVLGGVRIQQGYVYMGLRAMYCLDNVLNNNFMIDPSEVVVGNSHSVIIKGFLGIQF